MPTIYYIAPGNDNNMIALFNLDYGHGIVLLFPII